MVIARCHQNSVLCSAGLSFPRYQLVPHTRDLRLRTGVVFWGYRRDHLCELVPTHTSSAHLGRGALRVGGSVTAAREAYRLSES